jgi:hypothetical protein
MIEATIIATLVTLRTVLDDELRSQPDDPEHATLDRVWDNMCLMYPKESILAQELARGLPPLARRYEGLSS